jgi:hypothetical protein
LPAAVETDPSPDARRIVDQAILAVGGPEARQVFRCGYVKMRIEGDLPGITERFGQGGLAFEAYFDLPDFERRDIYRDRDGEHLLIITNSGTLWIGNQTGSGNTMRAPAPEVYKGPLLISILNDLIEIRDKASKLELAEADSDPTVDVIDVYFDDAIVSRISFDRQTRLPARIERTAVGLTTDKMGQQEETVTKLSAYRRFGATTLPTEVSLEQRGRRVVRFVLDSAEFNAPVDKGHFVIPE